MKMLKWYFGVKTDFLRSPGKNGRFISEVLGDGLWEMVEGSYPDHRPAEIWESIFTMGALFRKIARMVAESCGFVYPDGDDSSVSTFILKVKELPPDADDFGLIDSAR